MVIREVITCGDGYATYRGVCNECIGHLFCQIDSRHDRDSGFTYLNAAGGYVLSQNIGYSSEDGRLKGRKEDGRK